MGGNWRSAARVASIALITATIGSSARAFYIGGDVGAPLDSFLMSAVLAPFVLIGVTGLVVAGLAYNRRLEARVRASGDPRRLQRFRGIEFTGAIGLVLMTWTWAILQLAEFLP